MTSPDRARVVAELDALTNGLPDQAAALADRLDRVLHMRHGPIVNGRRWIDGTDYCPRCLTHTCPGCERRQEPTVVIVNGGVVELAGPDAEPLCVWCRETAGTCDRTGGLHRCDGTNEWHADQLAVAAAPRLGIIHTGGAR